MSRRTPPETSTTAAPAAGEAPLPVLPMLAYAYSFRLELPADKARGLLARHQEACENAGPALCQVVAANSTAEGRDQATGLCNAIKAAGGDCFVR